MRRIVTTVAVLNAIDYLISYYAVFYLGLKELNDWIFSFPALKLLAPVAILAIAWRVNKIAFLISSAVLITTFTLAIINNLSQIFLARL